MFWIILVIAIALIGGIRGLILDGFVLGVLKFLCWFIAAGVPATVLSLGLFYTTAEKYQGEPHSIESIQDGSGVSGNFFLGMGNINDEMRYAFYTETSEGVFKLKTVSADSASVSYTNEKPYYTKKCYRRGVPRFFAPFDKDCSASNNIRFYVPEGSIKQNFTLDAQ